MSSWFKRRGEEVMAAIAARYLDDLTVGQRFQTGTVSVDLQRIKAFAAEFDPQPFHLDEAAAASSIFGGLVASGWHTAALTMRLMVDSDMRVAGGLVGVGVEQVRWPHPVHPGDRLRVEVEVVEVRQSRSNPGRGIVRFKSQTLNQDAIVVMEQVASLVVPRDPARA
jgi:acyl dehydratase